ncbi:hypothetical protein ACHAXT_007985 [Thalassiosira profunda]
MYEWALGITDSRPASWRSCPPRWDDEKLTASSSHSFLDVMGKLCETAIKSRREYDHGIDEHLWKMRICSMHDMTHPPSAEDRIMRLLEDRDQDDDGSDDSDDEEKYRGNILIPCPQGEDMAEEFNDDEAQILSASTKLSRELLPEGHVLEVTYDYGTTTTIYLKVLSVKMKAVQSLLQYFSLESASANMLEELKAVPAYSLPKEKQVDHFFPYASKAFLGYYQPLFAGKSDEFDIGESQRVMGSVTMGLSSKIRSERDTTFCSMEDRNCSSDVLFCPGVLDPNELLQAVDKAWEPRERDDDPDRLEDYRYDWIRRFITGADDDEGAKIVQELIANDNGFGAKLVPIRLKKDREKSDFDFEAVFPKTAGQIMSGRFRWFQYKKGVLRVVVGRGMGQDNRQCPSDQILRTWNHEFETFHELLCAVEASWVWEGRELAADAVIAKFDTDLGPSAPLPKEPPCLGKETDAISISSCKDLKKLVTALAISVEDGKTVLYSGHDDGTLAKFSLDDNQELWSKKIYTDGTKDNERYMGGVGMMVQATYGVAGIKVRPNSSNPKTSIVYTWTDAYQGYPSRNYDDREASQLRGWSGENGELLRRFTLNIGRDEDGNDAYPSISTVVFCKALYNRAWQDTIVVGLHCCYNGLQWDEDDFDLEEMQDFSEGNIVPFLESSMDEMESWRGQGGIIQSMAVAGRSYVVSLSIMLGTGHPDDIVLWSLQQPGIPLYRKALWNHNERSVFRAQQTRLDDVAGISIDGKELLLTDLHGDRIAPMTIEKDADGSPYIEMHGYASIGSKYYEDEGYHGRMGVSSKHAAVAMEIEPTAWIFKIRGNSTHAKLDKRDGNPREFRDEGDHGFGDGDEKALQEKRAGREMAVGKVEFPKYGGNKPSRKKVKNDHFAMSFTDDSDGLGRGGPVTMAMRGRHLVGGFSNGSMVRFLLPEQFDDGDSSISANHLVSVCSLPSDEWHIPLLETSD